MLQETEKDELVQTKSKELAQAQEQMRQLRQQVSHITGVAEANFDWSGKTVARKFYKEGVHACACSSADY